MWKMDGRSAAAAPAAPQTPANDSPELQRMEQFQPEAPRRRLEDLVVPAAVRSRIEAALAAIVHRRALYEEWGLDQVDPGGGKVAVNLWGPPGTGKSFCAEAIAAHLGKQLLKVNYAEIESKYVGDTPKNIKAAFARARETGAVLFFDEADSILGKRLTSVTQSADHGVNVSRSVMLLELDAFDGVVLFATNLAQNYDGAFVRRIRAHVEFELPDRDCRRRLWEFMLPESLPRAEDVDPEWLAGSSEALSGGDFVNVVVGAASRAVQREGEARRVTRADLELELENVRRAKRHVGAEPGAVRVVEERELDPADVPEDVREAFEGRGRKGHNGTPSGEVPMA
ncbi:MAG TPA: ATP-binding protein [Anaeromyxobacteraceae bacterium]|nr:ATP-binding protein [Anaeromyxobacteraceae bacterium]